MIGHGVTDDISVASIVAGAHTVERTDEHLAHDPRNSFKLSLMVRGQGLLIQGGRETVLGPGDLAMYDTSQQYAMLFDEDFASVVMMFPHESLDLPLEYIQQLVGVKLGGDLRGLVGANLEWLGAHLGTLSGTSGARVARSVVDLVGTMLAQELGSDAVQDPRRQQLNAILKYIDANLAVPGLGPTQLALAHHISTRHLHALFHDGGTTVAAWIRQRRLDRCRRMLADPLNADVSIASVAAGSGFTDAAHFSRIFKAAYGESPTELRQRTRLAAAA